jgi:hypothetical protein
MAEGQAARRTRRHRVVQGTTWGEGGVSVHRLPEGGAQVGASPDLPPVEAVDQLGPEALIDLLTHGGALMERARARLTLIGGQRAADEPSAGDEYLTAEQVAELLNAEPAWVYRHRRQLGGDKLDGLVRFPRRRLEAYLARQHRLSG